MTMTATIPGTGKYEKLLDRCADIPPIPTAVAHPCEATASRDSAAMNPGGIVWPYMAWASPTRSQSARLMAKAPRPGRKPTDSSVASPPRVPRSSRWAHWYCQR